MRLLPARVVISTDWVNHLLIILPRVCAWLLKLTCTLLAWYLSVSTELKKKKSMIAVELHLLVLEVWGLELQCSIFMNL